MILEKGLIIDGFYLTFTEGVLDDCIFIVKLVVQVWGYFALWFQSFKKRIWVVNLSVKNFIDVLRYVKTGTDFKAHVIDGSYYSY